MQLLALPALADNYIWLLHDGQEALVVDPGAAAPVQEALQALGLSLAGIFITHQHADHIGALAQLRGQNRRTQNSEVPVWAARHPLIQAAAPASAQSVVVGGGERFRALGVDWQVLPAPGHTLSHVLFYAADLPLPAHGGHKPLLFCGDTLFSAGCGRLFEGSPAQMLATLQVINALPAQTLICCAHEYTQTNLRFALSLQPEHQAAAAHAAHCAALREQGLPTLPSTLGQERSFNPFLQALEPEWATAMALHLPLARADASVDSPTTLGVFTALRELRNHFS